MKQGILVNGTGGVGMLPLVSEALAKGKTAKERAENWLELYEMDTSPEMVRRIELLLKVQDRDTRHACAESAVTAEDGNEAHKAVLNSSGFS